MCHVEGQVFGVTICGDSVLKFCRWAKFERHSLSSIVKIMQGIPIDVALVQGEVFSAGVEVACLLVDIALKQMDDVCAEFFQADW